MKCESVRLDVGCRVASIYRVLFVSDSIAVDGIIVAAVRRRRQRFHIYFSGRLFFSPSTE